MSTKKDLISLANLSKADLQEILHLAKKLKKNPLLKLNSLKNKSIALIFAKPSLRTRVSFEVGIKELGGHPITIKMDEINPGIRENVEDIGNVLSRYVSGIVIRTFEQKQIETLAKNSFCPVINGLTNEEHPCQIISDFFTIKEFFGSLKGLKLTYIGDGNNVATSLLLGCALAGMNISIASPTSCTVSKGFVDLAKKINPKIKIELTTNPKKAAPGANVLYTDVWTSMGKEKELKKRKRIFLPYQINKKIVSQAKKDVIVLHCLPAHKGEEITKDVFDKFSDVIYRQAENRLHVQKAILVKLIG